MRRHAQDVTEIVAAALNTFAIELPSWGFADTGTRFGKFLQPAAATTVEEKLADAGQVHALTGACPTVALHVLWDLPNGDTDIARVERAAAGAGIRVGAINPNVFQDQDYKFGSFGNPTPRFATVPCNIVSTASAWRARSTAATVAVVCGRIELSRHRRASASASAGSPKALARVHAALDPSARMLVEYKPFEPAFYHTDIADWGMALLHARAAGPQAKVLVDTGHHYLSQNIEQIVAWLLDEGMLGGFHFNDRRYADDDLTMGSIDPYQIFRIFHEIRFFEWQTGRAADIAYMIDQSHNLKGKIEAMIQTVMIAQELYAKAALVDCERLVAAQQATDLVRAESCLQDAFATDVRDAVGVWRASRGLPLDPQQALRETGYIKRITKERAEHKTTAPSSYA